MHPGRRQVSFLLARQIGYQQLGVKGRSSTSSPDRVDSFQRVLNDFKASYFAGALVLHAHQEKRDWQEAIEQLLAR
ncbi:MAG TPA: hypothetical protein VLE70_03950 [Anaerolineae bacterium]|nr:hypothetical protein [Anaerolineae bacterium]